MENARGVDAGTEGQVGCRSGPGGCATWVGEVNGPEGETLDWSAVDWPVVEDRVQRLHTEDLHGVACRCERLQGLLEPSAVQVALSQPLP